MRTPPAIASTKVRTRPLCITIKCTLVAGYAAVLSLTRLFVVLAPAVALADGQASGLALLLDGARVIPGDGSTPIENASLLIDKGHIAAVGARGRVQVPAGARRVALAGKTIMPALVDGHVHLGYQVGLSFSADN